MLLCIAVNNGVNIKQQLIQEPEADEFPEL